MRKRGANETRKRQPFFAFVSNHLAVRTDTVQRSFPGDAGCLDQVHKPVLYWRDQIKFCWHPRFVGTHVWILSGASTKRGLRSTDCRDSRLPTQSISTISPCSTFASVRSTRSGHPHFPRQENEGCADETRAAQHPKTIQKPKQCRLLLNDSRQLRLGVHCCVWRSKSMG